MPKRTTRRRFLADAAGAGLAALASGCRARRPGPQSAKPRPNIILIVADDLGYGDIGCYGCPDTRTPSLDRLAAQGVRFTCFYSNGAECTPTRTALMTGRYQQRVGGLECAIGIGGVGRYDDAIRLAEKHQLGLPVKEPSIARMLKDTGYATALCGKWHLGYEPESLPRRHGFDYFFGPLGGGVDYFHHTEPTGKLMLYKNDSPVRRDGYLTDLISDEAVRLIESRRQRPFFLEICYTAPHAPYQDPNDPSDKPLWDAEWNKGTHATYVAMIERMDQGIGSVLNALDRAGLANDTIVVFTSDNGATKMGSNAPFSGGKSQLFEGGIRVPCIVRWPKVLPQGLVCDHVGITMDITASMARAAGVSPPPNRPFDGIDILCEVEAGRTARKRTLFWRHLRGDVAWRAVRDGSLKCISHRLGEQTKEYLFDLERDSGEKTNLSFSQPSHVMRLKGLLAAWENEVGPKR